MQGSVSPPPPLPPSLFQSQAYQHQLVQDEINIAMSRILMDVPNLHSHISWTLDIVSSLYRMYAEKRREQRCDYTLTFWEMLLWMMTTMTCTVIRLLECHQTQLMAQQRLTF